MSRTGTPAGQRALIAAAREEFAEHGYAGTSIRQIAQRAGMSLSVLYHYYSGKQELLWTIIEESAEAYFAYCSRELERAADDPASRLRALVAGTVRFRIDHPARSSVTRTEQRSLEPPYLERYHRRAADGSRLFADAIRDGLAAGVFGTPFPEDARRAIIAMCNAIADWYDPAGSLTVDEIVARYVALAFVIVEYRPEHTG